MEKTLVLTGWGYPEYVAAAAVALKTLNGRADLTRLHVRRVFEKYGQNLTRAAAALDVSRNTVRKYL